MNEASRQISSDMDASLGFAADIDVPIGYMQRTRDWYLALGYGNPYRWAHYTEAPFQPLGKPLSQCRAALVTTAAPNRPDRPKEPGSAYHEGVRFHAVYSGDTAADHDLVIDHVAVDFKHTSMADSGTWFPLAALRRAVARGRLGALAPRFHGVPTDRSQRKTIADYCPEVVARCRADGVDVALLVPNCPVCHQSLTLAARHLEAAGIATVVMGCAKDIVEHAAAPRLLFSDFPLGNGAGRPHDIASQDQTLELALRVLESAPGPRTTMVSPLRWSDSPEWKLDYANPERVSAAELAKIRAGLDRSKEIIRTLRKPAG
jgi:hypothetical protein